MCVFSYSVPPIILMNFPASPAVKNFLQSNVLYFGGDSDAFHSRYPAPVIPIVSMKFSSCYTFTDSFSRPLSSSNSRLSFKWPRRQPLRWILIIILTVALAFDHYTILVALRYAFLLNIICLVRPNVCRRPSAIWACGLFVV